MGIPGGFEWVIIILVIVLLFGAKKIPELARGIGQGIREFKQAKGPEEEKKIQDKNNDVKEEEKS